jgi:transcriptional regulator with XRE-family HTH domain
MAVPAAPPRLPHVGPRLRALREGAGLSLSQACGELAACGLGLHRSALSRVERGERDITASALYAFADAYHVPVSALVEHPEQAQPPSCACVLSPR